VVSLKLKRKEYLSLLTVLEIADWVLHAYKVEEPAETRPFRDLEQKLLSMATAFGCEDLVEYDPEFGRFFTTRDFEDSSQAMALIEEFEGDAFWDQLSERLVERDLLRQLGEDAFMHLGPEERDRLEEPYRRLYAEEFVNHGVDRLEVLDQDYVGGGSRKSRLS
jgi:hypothetical protein